MYVYMYIYTYVCMCIYTYIYIYILHICHGEQQGCGVLDWRPGGSLAYACTSEPIRLEPNVYIYIYIYIYVYM